MCLRLFSLRDKVLAKRHGWLKGSSSCGCKRTPYLYISTAVLDTWHEVLVLILGLIFRKCDAVHYVQISSCICQNGTYCSYCKDTSPLLTSLVIVLDDHHLWIIFLNDELQWFENAFTAAPKPMGTNNCFSKIISDVFTTWLCVNRHYNIEDQYIENFCFHKGNHTFCLSINHDFLIKQILILRLYASSKGCT